MKKSRNSKIKVLILGYSYIARKAIINAIENSPNFILAGIASNTNYKDIDPKYSPCASYDEAINSIDYDVVYISLHNGAHYKWIIKSLENKKHVICDKPAVLNEKQALKCYELAGENLLLFESIAYPYHNQHIILKKYIEKEKNPLQKITAHFGFPPLNKNNFRNFAKFGGGCLYDIGPYMISLGQLYFNKRARRIYCSAYTPEGFDVPTSASILVHYGINEILEGHFGFQLEYRNNINLWGQNFNYYVDRAFTIPPNLPNVIFHKKKDKIINIPVPACDQFLEMFNFFNKLLKDGKTYKNYNRKFLNQAIQLDAMIKSAQTKNFEIMDYGMIK